MANFTLSSESPIRGAENLSQRVLDSLTAEVAVLDQSGTIIAVNKAWSQFAADNGGTVEKTGVGANYLEVCRSPAGEDAHDGERVGRGIEQVLSGSLDVFKFEYACHSATIKRWFLLHVSRLDASDSFVVMTHMSITERKLTERRLVVAERLAAIGEAMNGLSHEGRNALQRAQAHIALLRTHAQHNPESLDLLQKIEDAQDHMLGLYEEVKSYASPIKLQIQPYDLGKLVEEVWEEFASTDRPVNIRQSSRTRDLTCNIDAKAIGDVLRAVFQNALAAAIVEPKIEAQLFDDVLDGRPAVTIVVSDDGAGVPVAHREQVFQPFYTTKTRGTGLGLALAKRIVLQHKGQIDFGRPRLAGASVYISLPR